MLEYCFQIWHLKNINTKNHICEIKRRKTNTNEEKRFCVEDVLSRNIQRLLETLTLYFSVISYNFFPVLPYHSQLGVISASLRFISLITLRLFSCTPVAAPPCHSELSSALVDTSQVGNSPQIPDLGLMSLYKNPSKSPGVLTTAPRVCGDLPAHRCLAFPQEFVTNRRRSSLNYAIILVSPAFQPGVRC